jgi:immune inhibitor A
MRKTWLLLSLCLLLFSACSSGSNQPTATVTPAPTVDTSTNLPSPTPESLQSLMQTEQLLLLTPHPLRNLYDIAQRLKLHTSIPIAHVVRTTPLHTVLGQEAHFWINNLDTRHYSRISAKLVYITEHVFMYVEDGQAVNLNALQASANIFESRIYPTDRTTFGSKWSPGIDGDVHLTILNAVGMGMNVGGYFSPEDEYPTSINPYSNEREMFYVNIDGPLPGSADYNSTLAHEFQHMIHWYQHPVDLSWNNEGMSVLAQHLNGYPTGGLEQSFLQTPDTQLNDWSDDMSLTPAHYGAGYLFMDYFATHYGGYALLKELLQDPASPPDNFNHVLAKHGYQDTFNDVLHNWYIANYVQDTSVEQGAYGYPDLTLTALTPQHTFNGYPISQSDTVHQYAAEYYALPAPGRTRTLTISLKGSPFVRMINNDPFAGTANEWWGNRYDNMDSTLTRSFDLTHVRGRRATLQFAAWFDLERDYDYAFVEVSTGDGNWTTLKGHYTTTSNPNGANWGNGYTGASGGGNHPVWVQEQVDLSSFVGKKIQIRFEEITDASVNLQGFAIDAIRIPELHFQDTLASDNGWVSNGFVRSQNVLPEHYDIQVLLYHGTQITVKEVAADLANGQATLTIPNYGVSVNRAVLIVSAYAAETTQLAHYQLDIHVR